MYIYTGIWGMPMGSSNEMRCYIVTPPLISWTHTDNGTCYTHNASSALTHSEMFVHFSTVEQTASSKNVRYFRAFNKQCLMSFSKPVLQQIHFGKFTILLSRNYTCKKIVHQYSNSKQQLPLCLDDISCLFTMWYFKMIEVFIIGNTFVSKHNRLQCLLHTILQL